LWFIVGDVSFEVKSLALRVEAVEVVALEFRMREI
jgi:hypothetical protein